MAIIVRTLASALAGGKLTHKVIEELRMQKGALEGREGPNVENFWESTLEIQQEEICVNSRSPRLMRLLCVSVLACFGAGGTIGGG